MIEVKAIQNDERKGTEVSISIDGSNRDLFEESIAIVQAVMGSIKEADILLHTLLLKTLADNPHILLGEDVEEEIDQLDTRHITFKEGVN